MEFPPPDKVAFPPPSPAEGPEAAEEEKVPGERGDFAERLLLAVGYTHKEIEALHPGTLTDDELILLIRKKVAGASRDEVKQRVTESLQLLMTDGKIRVIPSDPAEIKAVVAQIQEVITSDQFDRISGRVSKLLADIIDEKISPAQALFDIEFGAGWRDIDRPIALYFLGVYMASAIYLTLSRRTVHNLFTDHAWTPEEVHHAGELRPVVAEAVRKGEEAEEAVRLGVPPGEEAEAGPSEDSEKASAEPEEIELKPTSGRSKKRNAPRRRKKK